MDTIKEEKIPTPVAVPCPAPFTVTLDATTANVVLSDFSAVQLANYQTALGYPLPNKAYAHTFVWKPNLKCCKVTSAVLTVKMKSIQKGKSKTSPDSGNDTISVVENAGALSTPPYSEYVYSAANYPFPVGTAATKTWNITGSALARLNSAHTLSIFVQDDTTILSATLVLTGCCL